MTDFERARRAMVDNQLTTRGIVDRRILVAMGEVPRERFVPKDRQPLAYIDEAHVFHGHQHRALAAPAPFAKLVQLAGIGPADDVLDVGVGSGYSAAVIAKLAGTVVAIENEPELVKAARENLAAVGAGAVQVVDAAFEAGAPKHGPYDVIIIEGAVTAVPDKLLGQLKDGGRLVALIQTGVTAVAHIFVRAGDDVTGRPEFDASMPPLAAERPAETFVF